MPVFVHEARHRLVSDNHRAVLSERQYQAGRDCPNGPEYAARAFGVPKIGIKRAVKLYHEAGPKRFYAERAARGPAVLTLPVLKQAQQLLDEGLETPEVADQLGIKCDILSKAVRAGRLPSPLKKAPAAELSTKSERSAQDSTE